MTTYPTVGLPRPHIRAPGRTTSQHQYPSNGLGSKPVLIDLTDPVRGPREGEAPNKRRKTENESLSTQGDGGEIRPAFQHGGKNESSRQASRQRQFLPFEAQLAQANIAEFSQSSTSILPGGGAAEAPEKSQSLPPLPTRPGSHLPSKSHRQNRITGFGRGSGREGVQAKPYVLEAPPFAPHYEQNSMLWPYIVA